MYVIAVVLGILTVGGLLGGWAGYLTESIPQPPALPEDDGRRLRRHLVLGLVASACVPLFLSILQSSILDEIFKDAPSDPTPVVDYFVLAGFSLLAAFASRNFIDTLAAQLLKKAAETEVTAQVALAASAEAVEKADTAIEIVDEPADSPPLSPDDIQARKASASFAAAPVRLSAVETAVLSAMMTTTYRTASGIAAEIHKTRAEVAELLAGLADKNLVERTISPKTLSPRWRVTSQGVNTLG